MIEHDVSDILITGSGGFIGSHLVKKFKNMKLVLDSTKHTKINLLQRDEVLALPPANNVIHLGAKIPKNDIDSSNYFYENVLSTLNILEYCLKQNSKKLIYVSSYVYGKPHYCPIDEDHPTNPHTSYNESKYICENICKSYNEKYGLNIIILRPFNIYGKLQKLGFLIPNLITAIQTNTLIKIINKKSKRDFLFIDDFTELVSMILNLNSNFEIFNVGSGTSHSFEEILGIIEKITNKNFQIAYEEKEHIFIPNIIADISKIKKCIDWEPKVTLENGLKILLSN